MSKRYPDSFFRSIILSRSSAACSKVEVCGCGAHLFFYLGDEFGEFFAGHGLWGLSGVGLQVSATALDTAMRSRTAFLIVVGVNSMFFVVGFLDGATAVGFGDGFVHGIGHVVCVHDSRGLRCFGQLVRWSG